MAKREPKNGDRVRRTDTGETAWFVQSHQGGQVTVLPEGSTQAQVWEKGLTLEVVPGAPPWK